MSTKSEKSIAVAVATAPLINHPFRQSNQSSHIAVSDAVRSSELSFGFMALCVAIVAIGLGHVVRLKLRRGLGSPPTVKTPTAKATTKTKHKAVPCTLPRKFQPELLDLVPDDDGHLNRYDTTMIKAEEDVKDTVNKQQELEGKTGDLGNGISFILEQVHQNERSLHVTYRVPTSTRTLSGEERVVVLRESEKAMRSLARLVLQTPEAPIEFKVEPEVPSMIHNDDFDLFEDVSIDEVLTLTPTQTPLDIDKKRDKMPTEISRHLANFLNMQNNQIDTVAAVRDQTRMLRHMLELLRPSRLLLGTECQELAMYPETTLLPIGDMPLIRIGNRIFTHSNPLPYLEIGGFVPVSLDAGEKYLFPFTKWHIRTLVMPYEGVTQLITSKSKSRENQAEKGIRPRLRGAKLLPKIMWDPEYGFLEMMKRWDAQNVKAETNTKTTKKITTKKKTETYPTSDIEKAGLGLSNRIVILVSNPDLAQDFKKIISRLAQADVDRTRKKKVAVTDTTVRDRMELFRRFLFFHVQQGGGGPGEANVKPIWDLEEEVETPWPDEDVTLEPDLKAYEKKKEHEEYEKEKEQARTKKDAKAKDEGKGNGRSPGWAEGRQKNESRW